MRYASHAPWSWSRSIGLPRSKKSSERWPGPDEELFFDGTHDEPVRARPDQIKRQVLDAAHVHNLQVMLLLSFFGIPPDLD